MKTELATSDNFPKDERTGLTLPLSKYLGLHDMRRHRAMVAMELEVMAKKMDRFGWERDRGSMAHDRLVTDWMDALQDYPLDEVKAACRAWVDTNSRKMPNEGDISKLILAARSRAVQAHKASMPMQDEPSKPRATKEQTEAILREAGFSVKRFGGGA